MAKMGRPKAPETEAVLVRIDLELLQKIDNFRRQEDGLPSRQEVLRRAVAEWLEGKAK